MPTSSDTSKRIIDAGPGLNFLATHSEKLLTEALGHLHMTETVIGEIDRRSKRDSRFKDARRVLAKMTPGWVTPIPDDLTDVELDNAVYILTGEPIDDRFARDKDLGEVTVLAHAIVESDHGRDVIVLIDDGCGRVLAQKAISRADRRRRQRQAAGQITLLSTLDIFAILIRRGHFANKGELKAAYLKIAPMDDGLCSHFEDTALPAQFDAWSES